MTGRVEILRSPKAFELRLLMFSVAYFILSLLVAYLLFILLPNLEADQILDLVFASLVIAGIYALSSGILWSQWKNTKYYISSTSLIIKQKANGLLPIYKEKIYTLDSIKSAEIDQNAFSNSKGYGDVILQIHPTREHIILKDVYHPEQLSEQIGKSIGVLTTQTTPKFHDYYNNTNYTPPR